MTVVHHNFETVNGDAVAKGEKKSYHVTIETMTGSKYTHIAEAFSREQAVEATKASIQSGRVLECFDVESSTACKMMFSPYGLVSIGHFKP